MNTLDLSFFILSLDIEAIPGFAVIDVDHDVLMNIFPEAHHLLECREIEFILWYQEQIYEGLLPPVSFIVDSVSLDQYDQKKVCEAILEFLKSPTDEDSDFFKPLRRFISAFFYFFKQWVPATKPVVQQSCKENPPEGLRISNKSPVIYR